MWLIVYIERSLAMHGAVGFEDVSRGRFAHDDVLQTHQAVEQSFRTRRTSGNVNVDRDRAIDEIISEIREKVNKQYPQLDVEFIQVLQDMIGDLTSSPEPIELKMFLSSPWLKTVLMAALAMRSSRTRVPFLDRTVRPQSLVGDVPSALFGTWLQSGSAVADQHIDKVVRVKV